VRYRMLETLRQFARERLEDVGDADTLQDRHRDFFLSLAEQAEAELAGPDRRAWLDRFEAEHDNLRAALDWSLSGKAEGGRRKDEGDPNPNLHPSGTREAGVFILHPSEAALRLATALWTFWNVRGHWTEGRSWLEGALAASPTAPAARRAPALLRAG